MHVRSGSSGRLGSAPRPSPGQLDRALTILDAEARDGFRDRVVIGGLAGFVRHAAAAAPDGGLRQAAALLADYRTLPVQTRALRLAEAVRLLLEEREQKEEKEEKEEKSGAGGAASPVGVGPKAPPRALHPTRARVSAPPPAGLTPQSAIESLKGVGPQRARLYKRLGLTTISDLLFHYPTRHVAYPPATAIDQVFFQDEASVVGTLERLDTEILPRGLKRLRATVRDDTGVVEAVWLRHGNAYLGIKVGEAIALSGKLQRFGRRLTFDNPEYERGDEPALHTRGLVPVYPLTAGLFDKELRTRIHWAVEHFASALVDPLPATVRAEQRLAGLDDALRSLHFPGSLAEHEAARRRLAFEELLTIQLVVLRRRRAWQAGGAVALPRRGAALDALKAGLPFRLTAAQERVTGEILADTTASRPMTRLLQGEVGSGKTAVAALALMNAVANGYQGAIMAPTEILAEQHYASLARLYAAAGERLEAVLGRVPVVRLLTGSVKGKERSAVYAEAAAGGLDVLVGTQALIQQSLDFARLALVVVDEQHRFGVKQRVTLRRKAQELVGVPHLLVMTATPIPRTLALSLYGDLDLSAIDEMPPGRTGVRTVVLGPDERDLAYERVRRAAALGRQAFIICPLVEESASLEARAATEEYERLRTGELRDLRLGLLHGRMKPAEKDAAMRAFRDHETDALVSTAVVEVGVDVPNATVMVIEGAERFGLAQLHQFRGRVGRGEHAADCVLVSDLADPTTNERLRAIERSANGLELAEQDLRLRGPGDYFGVRQSGLPDLRVARLDDAGLVEGARRAASAILASDPELLLAEHESLRAHLAAFQARAEEPS